MAYLRSLHSSRMFQGLYKKVATKHFQYIVHWMTDLMQPVNHLLTKSQRPDLHLFDIEVGTEPRGGRKPSSVIV